MNNELLLLPIEKLKTEQEKIHLKLTSLRDELRFQIDSDDLEDTVPDVMEHQMILGRIRDLESKLKSIEYALQRVEQGNYGLCERCGNPIDADRLEIIPETVLCIQCKNNR